MALGDEYQRALCDLDLSEAYLELNLVQEAEELARSAFEGFDRLKMPPEAARALTIEALALDRKHRHREALDKLRRARKIFVQEENRLWPAQIDLYRAVTLRRAGKIEKALEAVESALTIFDAFDLSSRAVTCELLRCRLLLHRDRVGAARDAWIAAKERLAKQTLPTLEQEAQEVLGEVAEAEGNSEEALEAFVRCDQLLERVRSRLRGESLRISFLRDKRVIYESLVWLTSRKVSSERDASRVLHWVERAKSRGLAELLAFRTDDLALRDLPRDEMATKIRQTRDELSWLYRQIDRRQMDGDSDALEEISELQARIRSKEGELLQFQREWEAEESTGSDTVSAPSLDPSELRAGLGDDVVLLNYFVARGTIFAAVIDHSKIELVEIGRAEAARKVHRLLQFQLSRAGEGSSSPAAKLIARATRDHLRTLYTELIEPLENRLGDRRLVVSPHDFLHYVPFHALLDAEGEAVIDRRAVTYTPSAGVHHLCALQEPGAAAGALVLGVADEKAPQILAEVRAVAGTLQRAGTETLLFEGEAATEEALRQNGPGRRFVHLATHGIFRRDNPMFSAIQLGTSRLSLFDLYGLRLDAELAVLSGCGTGLAAVHGADELVGLTRGLLYAGARSVLVSLWNVHDESTAELMDRFYGHLVAGIDPADALRATLKEHRESYPEPYFWAPFVLVGA